MFDVPPPPDDWPELGFNDLPTPATRPGVRMAPERLIDARLAAWLGPDGEIGKALAGARHAVRWLTALLAVTWVVVLAAAVYGLVR